MKKHPISLALVVCATAFPAFAQDAIPNCESANYDSTRNVFTVMNSAPSTLHQQCLLTIHPARTSTGGTQTAPARLVEGRYTVLLSGGGGGGAGGEFWDHGGGSGGAGAVPNRTVHYLAPNVYKLTLGAGGEGALPGGPSFDGNRTSLAVASSGVVVAGHPDPLGATQRVRKPGTTGYGGVAQVGGSSGGNGGDTSSANNESPAQPGGASQTPGYAGVGGPAGTEGNAKPGDGRAYQANAGGGGGAGVGNGGGGGSVLGQFTGGDGELGGGGGGGRGANLTAYAGGRGGHGFVQLTKLD